MIFRARTICCRHSIKFASKAANFSDVDVGVAVVVVAVSLPRQSMDASDRWTIELLGCAGGKDYGDTQDDKVQAGTVTIVIPAYKVFAFK